MKFDPLEIAEIARTTRFDPANVEKALRLKHLLVELNRHETLRGKLVLKGGTALNVFHQHLPRLSIDIDLNYIGQVQREAMLKDRPGIERAAIQVCEGLGYRIQPGTEGYALSEICLSYTNHAGRYDQIQVELNFLMRVCALPPKTSKARQFGDEEACDFPVLAIEELMAGKIKALIERFHPRDIYDLFQFERDGARHDAEMLRKLTVLFGATLNRDLREYKADRYEELGQEDVERLLYPLLRSDDRPNAGQMLTAVRPLLSAVLDHKREEPFLEAIAAGEYHPELLFPENPEVVRRIERHPALLWKVENVSTYLADRRGRR